nr:expressed protein [Hymenolepis microstoma]
MRSLLILFVCVLSMAIIVLGENCKRLGEQCDRTVFNRCCKDLYCVLAGPGDGTCQPCLPSSHFCFRDSECCSRNCAWYFFCK